MYGLTILKLMFGRIHPLILNPSKAAGSKTSVNVCKTAGKLIECRDLDISLNHVHSRILLNNLVENRQIIDKHPGDPQILKTELFHYELSFEPLNAKVCEMVVILL